MDFRGQVTCDALGNPTGAEFRRNAGVPWRFSGSITSDRMRRPATEVRVQNDSSGLLERLERVLSDTFFLEHTEKQFDDAVLLQCVRREGFVLQPMVLARLP